MEISVIALYFSQQLSFISYGDTELHYRFIGYRDKIFRYRANLSLWDLFTFWQAKLQPQQGQFLSRKNWGPFSVAIENVGLVHEWFQTLARENSKDGIRQRYGEEWMMRIVNIYERTQARKNSQPPNRNLGLPSPWGCYSPKQYEFPNEPNLHLWSIHWPLERTEYMQTFTYIKICEI